MSELRKPSDSTPEAFMLAVKAAQIEKGGRNYKTLGAAMNIAPKRAKEIINGDFHQIDFDSLLEKSKSCKGNESGSASKLLRGCVGSLSRFCRYLELDFESCARACGIPEECLSYEEALNPDKGILKQAVTKAMETLVDEAAWQKVHAIMQVVGPITLKQISELLETARANCTT